MSLKLTRTFNLNLYPLLRKHLCHSPFIPDSNLPSFAEPQGLPFNAMLPNEIEREAHVPRHRKSRKTKLNTILAALEGLRKQAVLSSSETLSRY